MVWIAIKMWQASCDSQPPVASLKYYASKNIRQSTRQNCAGLQINQQNASIWLQLPICITLCGSHDQQRFLDHQLCGWFSRSPIAWFITSSDMVDMDVMEMKLTGTRSYRTSIDFPLRVGSMTITAAIFRYWIVTLSYTVSDSTSSSARFVTWPPSSPSLPRTPSAIHWLIGSMPFVSLTKNLMRERERERQRQRQRQTDRQRDRQTETDRETDRQRDRQTDRQTDCLPLQFLVQVEWCDPFVYLIDKKN